MKARLALAPAALAVLAGPAAAQTGAAVVPAAFDGVEAPSANSFPFDGTVARYQQAYGSADLAGIVGQVITRIELRLDEASSVAGALSYASLRMRLSTGAGLVDALAADLDQNPGADELVVFDGPYAAPPPTAGGSPNPFDLAFDLAAPFFYAGGDLLLDVEIAAASVPQFYLDASNLDSDTTSRAFLTDAVQVDTGGLVTRFVTGTPPSAVDPMADCGGNQGLLVHVSGQPVIGQSMKLAMDAGQAPGVVGFLAFALAPVPGWPPCGLALPGVGELLLDPAPPTPVLLLGGAATWSGTAPLDFSFPIPDDPTLLTADVYVQGLWADLAGAAPAEPLRLTTGIALLIGG